MKDENLDHWLDAAQIRLGTIIEQSRTNAGERQYTEEILQDLSAALEELNVAVHQLTTQNEELLALRNDVETERQRYRELFEFAPCGYVVTDTLGIINEANSAAAGLFGVKQQFLKGKPLMVFLAAAELQKTFRTRLDCLIESRETMRAEWEILLQPRGSAPVPAAITIAVVRDGRQRGTELRWLLRDITEQKQTQEMIRHVMVEYQAMLENAFDGVFLVKDRKLVKCNHKLEEMLGYGREELIGQSTEVLYPSREAWEKIGKSIYAKLSEGVPYQHEVQVRRKDGTEIWCSMAGVMVDSSAPDKGSIWRLQDITERKEAHNVLESAHNELEARVRQRTSALSEANMALNAEIAERKRVEQALRESEVRLRGLSNHLQSVREEQSAKIASEVHDELGGTLTVLKLGLSSILDKMKEQSGRDKLASLVLLTDSAIKGVKRISTSLRPGMLDTLGLITTIRWHVNEFSELTGIRHELNLPKYIRLSPERNTAVFRIIQEALTNIARHAEATKVAIHIWKHKGQLFIEIEDDGKGITDESLSKPKSFGILNMHERSHYLGGDLTLSRSESGGTTATLSFPLEHSE